MHTLIFLSFIIVVLFTIYSFGRLVYSYSVDLHYKLMSNLKDRVLQDVGYIGRIVLESKSFEPYLKARGLTPEKAASLITEALQASIYGSYSKR